MIRIFILAVCSCSVLVSCVSTSGPYQPVTKPEKIEFTHDRLDVYPGDVRTDPADHTNTPVVWVGIIRSTVARDLGTGTTITANTVFEHHYFDWVQDAKGSDVKLAVSPRGEGLFSAKWLLDITSQEATARNVENYAAPGKLAIVYGVPQSVDADGTVVVKYRYLRILDADHFSTNEFDYGRLGEPFHVLNAACKTDAPSAKGH